MPKFNDNDVRDFLGNPVWKDLESFLQQEYENSYERTDEAVGNSENDTIVRSKEKGVREIIKLIFSRVQANVKILRKLRKDEFYG